MRILAPAVAILAATALACSNDSKLQDTASHGAAGATGGDTARATANTSGTGTPTNTPNGATGIDTSAAKKGAKP